MPSDAVHLQSVRFAYTPGQTILSIDELRISAGHRIFLHGPSGSGKTTLLSLISGVLIPQKGSVAVLGQDLTRISASPEILFAARESDTSFKVSTSFLTSPQPRTSHSLATSTPLVALGLLHPRFPKR
jgi:ABC-type cobalamin/Fe3+-siderophores transport system ATPase subunit